MKLCKNTFFSVYTGTLIIARKNSSGQEDRIRGQIYHTFNLVSPTENWIIFYSHLIVVRNLINHFNSLEIINVFKRILDRSNLPVINTLTNQMYVCGFLEAIYDESTRTYISLLPRTSDKIMHTSLSFSFPLVHIYQSRSRIWLPWTLLTKIASINSSYQRKRKKNIEKWTKYFRIQINAYAQIQYMHFINID